MDSHECVLASRSAAVSYAVKWSQQNKGLSYLIEPAELAHRESDAPWRFVGGAAVRARPAHYFESAPVKIGDHEWRVVVKDSGFYGRVTEYQYRYAGAERWRPDTEWPTYNSNDGMYAGCPKSLATRVYRANKLAIDAALYGVPMPCASAMTLF